MKKLLSVMRITAPLVLLSGLVCIAWFPGRMTGGGSVFQAGSVDSAQFDSSGRVTHGFEIHCGSDANHSSTKNNLEINWVDASGKHHRFHLDDTLQSADCTWDPTVGSPNPPPANFNRFDGIGTGKFDGAAGATIRFTLTDAGEPGTSDTAAYSISDASGTVVLQVPPCTTPDGYGRCFLNKGNQQAHDQ